GEKDSSRANAGRKMQKSAAAIVAGELQRRYVGQRGSVLLERVPPHQFVYIGLRFVIKLLDGALIFRTNLFLPFTFGCAYRLPSPSLDLIQVVTAHVRAQFPKNAFFQIAVSFHDQRILPDLPVAVDKALLLEVKLFSGGVLIVDALPQIHQYIR